MIRSTSLLCHQHRFLEIPQIAAARESLLQALHHARHELGRLARIEPGRIPAEADAINIPIRCPGDVSVALAGPRSVLQSMSPEARGKRVDAILQSRTKSHRIETATDAAGKPGPMGGMIREAARADRC